MGQDIVVVLIQKKKEKKMATGGMTITVMSMVGNRYRLNVEANTTVQVLQEMIEEESGISVSRQKLVTIKKQPLDSSKTIADYGIKNKGKLFLIVMAENFEAILGARGPERHWTKVFQDSSSYYVIKESEYQEIYVTFKDGKPVDLIRYYHNSTYPNFTYRFSWDTAVVSCYKGHVKDKPCDKGYSDDNLCTIELWHHSFNRIVTFCFYNENTDVVDQWCSAFEGMAAASHIFEKESFSNQDHDNEKGKTNAN